ncbi:hypothetical protein LINGRAHAP2_LOCUS34632 [Linum grandiflorum]
MGFSGFGLSNKVAFYIHIFYSLQRSDGYVMTSF